MVVVTWPVSCFFSFFQRLNVGFLIKTVLFKFQAVCLFVSFIVSLFLLLFCVCQISSGDTSRLLTYFLRLMPMQDYTI